MNDEIPMKDLFPLKLERCLRNIIFLGNCNKYIAFIDDTEDGILFEPSEEKVIVKGYCNEHTRPPFEVKTIKKIAFILLQNSRTPTFIHEIIVIVSMNFFIFLFPIIIFIYFSFIIFFFCIIGS